MSLVDLAALVGASAWIPVIIDWIIKWLRCPCITIIIDKSPEIGYSTFGSILNYKIALTAENGPVVITKMEIELSHESGEKRTLTWEGMVQQYGSMTIDDKKVPMEKDQVALAIKINDNDVEQTFFRFQNHQFNTDRRALYMKAVERRTQIKLHNANYQEELIKSDEVSKLRSHIVHGQTWKPGVYNARILITTLGKSKTKGSDFSFNIPVHEVERLDLNKEQIDHIIKNEIYNGCPGYEEIPIFWQWLYPDLINNGDIHKTIAKATK